MKIFGEKPILFEIEILVQFVIEIMSAVPKVQKLNIIDKM